MYCGPIWSKDPECAFKNKAPLFLYKKHLRLQLYKKYTHITRRYISAGEYTFAAILLVSTSGP